MPLTATVALGTPTLRVNKECLGCGVGGITNPRHRQGVGGMGPGPGMGMGMDS